MLAPTQPTAKFQVKWSGKDVGSGIKDYTIYLSENGGPFTAWLSNTAATSGNFSGQSGKTYAFYSVARDHAGNVEETPQSADTTTNVAVQPVSGDINNDGKVDCNDLAIVKQSFGKRSGQTGFDSRADVNRDGTVDIRDLAFVSQKMPAGTHCP